MRRRLRATPASLAGLAAWSFMLACAAPPAEDGAAPAASATRAEAKGGAGVGASAERALPASGAVSAPGSVGAAPAAAPQEAATAVARPAGAGTEEPDLGDFRLRYGTVEADAYRELQDTVRASQLFENTLADLNETVKLPTDIWVILRECGEVNAFYEPEDRAITVCYEMIEQFAQQFPPEDDSEEAMAAAGAAIAGATLFVFYHEAGHAVIHLYDLPVTGREEDAVDQLATLVLLERGGEEGERAAVDSASTFLGDDEEELGELAFWDEHSLDRQRFFSLVCWIYGKNPEEHEHLVADGVLPPERAKRCPAEYRRMARAWKRLLDPYLKG